MLNSNCFDSVEDYLKFYGLDIAAAAHEFVPFKSNGFDPSTVLGTSRLTAGGFELAGHIFKPVNYKATVVILHGYLNHCGLLSKLIRYLLEAGFAVAVFDLPGHGLSSGEPTAIDDFTQYSQSLNDFLNIIRQKLNGPYHIIGHSTGAAVIMDYLLGGGDDCFDRVIFVAPLVRSELWFLIKLGYKAYQSFAKNIFRVFRNVSSDKDFLRFVKYKDPLQSKKVSIKWINAMFKWDKKIANAKTSQRPTLVIQGTKDNIIDWRYNIRFILSKFKNSRIELIENARHELFNESAEIRETVFSQIKDYLKKSEA
ncbi:MAG: alpha/beta hydrolase [Phycisphaerae bacterium]|nr:alpha/beta hydrolase [Phycisphaerae bacterium]